MSTNPFRKINAEPQSSAPANPAGTGTTQPLSINTSSKTEKHVRISSPPDTAFISPASYPSSPEFARASPSPQQTVVSYPFDATFQTAAGDPFGAAESFSDDGDEDQVVSEALKNTRINIASTRAPPDEASKPEDAVQNTLNRFASRPRDGKTQATQSAAEAKQDPRRQTMDVDAFTRLLLTGGGGSTQGNPAPTNAASTGLPSTLSESSSTADSASISHQSIFEPMPPIAADSPRTSQELDEAESAAARRSAGPGESTEVIKKPPPAPRPRHGKLIKQAQRPSSEPIRQPPHMPIAASTLPEPRSPDSDLNKPLPPPPTSDSSRRSSTISIVGTDPSMQIKRAPTPPLARRRSLGPNKVSLSRSSPPLQPSPSSSSSSSHAKTPPPPPRRTSQRLTETTGPSSLPSTSEETDPVDLSQPIMPQLSRTASVATRASIISSENAPPKPPPPRRHRGSSNASQRPSIGMTSTSAVAGSSRSSRSSIEGQRPGLEATGNVSGGSSRDILKDLASLQAEVDALRKQGFRE